MEFRWGCGTGKHLSHIGIVTLALIYHILETVLSPHLVDATLSSYLWKWKVVCSRPRPTWNGNCATGADKGSFTTPHDEQ